MKRTLIATLGLTLALASCDNLLDLSPKSEISQEDYFRTESDLQLFSKRQFVDSLFKKD